HSATVYNGRVYVVGGTNGQNGYYKDVWYSGLVSGGGLTGWQPSMSLSTARLGHGAAVVNGTLIVAGGETGAGISTGTVETASIAGVAPVGQYERFIDLQLTAFTVDSLTVNGTAGLGGVVSLQY